MENKLKPEFGTRETGMFVPEGFFEEFQKNLEMRIDQEIAEKQKTRHITLRRWSIAASICLLLGLAPVAWHLFGTGTAEQPQTTAPEEVYAEVVYEDMNTEEIMVSAISDLDIYEYFYADL